MTFVKENYLRTFRRAKEEDMSNIKKLYLAAASQSNGIARKPHEITDKYINKIVSGSIKKSLIMIAEEKDQIIGSVNALKLGPECFSHVLSDLTFVIHPEFQGKGVGKALFKAFLEEIKKTMPEVKRIELFVRSSNEKAIKLYESCGFEKEGFLRRRIKNSEGIAEADVIMGWINFDN